MDDRFELDEKLGEGGMGAVYRARDKELGRVVAVKVIAMAVDAESIRRFQREMKLLSRLSHANIIRVYDAGQTKDGRAYFSMELIEGEDLDYKRRRDGPMPFDQVIPILLQTADALANIHAQGLLHRDIKPGNLMLETGGRVVVMDFGLVKDPSATMLTQEGRAVGTPRYMPPEVLAAREPSGAVDVWALGITAYELLTGRQCYPVNSLTEMMDLIVNHPPPDLESQVTGLPRWFVDLYLSTLAKDPAERPTAARVVDALKRRGTLVLPGAATTSGQIAKRKMLTTSFKVLAPPTPAPSLADTVGKRAGRVAIAALLLGALGLGARWMSPPPPSPAPSAPPEPAVQPLEIHLVPPRRAVVQVAPSLTVGAHVLVNGISRNAEGTTANPNEAVFDDLPPATELTVKLVAADGRELITRTVRTPAPVRLGSLALHPTDDTVMIDFDVEASRKLTVSLHRPGQDAPVAEVTRESGQRYFHHIFTGLRPHTQYLARASDTSGWSALVNYPFETKRIEHRKAYDAMLPALAHGWTTSLYDLDVMRAEPDPRAKPIIAEILAKSDSAEVLDTRKLLWVVEELYDQDLSGLLFDIYLRYSQQDVSHELFRGAYSGRHPALVRAAADLMSRPNQGARRWLMHNASDAGGPEACDKVARLLEADPSWPDERTPHLFVRTDPERARAHLERLAGAPTLDAQLGRWVCAGLGVLGDARAAKALGKLARASGRPHDRAVALRFLVPIADPAARDELLAAFQAEPDDPALSWALATSGDPRAADLFVARLAAAQAPRVRQDAAFALGLLGARTPPVLAALRDALAGPADVAGAAAYALGELQDAIAAPALTALAESDRDSDGLAALALARLRHKPAVAALAAQLIARAAKAAATPLDPRGWVRLAAQAGALGELGDPAAADALHALEKTAGAPRGTREAAQSALRRIARAAVESVGETRVLVIPQVPAVRCGFTLSAGESLEITGTGCVSCLAPDSVPLPPEVEVPVPGGARFGVSALFGTNVMRIGRSPNRMIAEQTAHLLLSAYDLWSSNPLIPRDAVTGFALVSLRR